MDVARPQSVARNKKIKRSVIAVVVLIAAFGVTVGLSRMKPAAPSVDRGTLWVDTVKRGEMLRQVQRHWDAGARGSSMDSSHQRRNHRTETSSRRRYRQAGQHYFGHEQSRCPAARDRRRTPVERRRSRSVEPSRHIAKRISQPRGAPGEHRSGIQQGHSSITRPIWSSPKTV